MRRFHTDPSQITQTTATIIGPEAKHIRQVLRLNTDHLIEIIDGSGVVYLAKICAISKHTVETEIINRITMTATPPFLHVAQSLLKGKKMDFLYQKLTELSVEGLHPFFSQFSDSKTRNTNHIERWERISLEACKQCKRPTLMQCPSPLSYSELLSQSDIFDTKILFWENETDQFLSSLPDFPSQTGATLILLGPEGGFSNEEIDQAKSKGFITASLGPQILRAETAALTATAITQHLLGNFNHHNTINWESTA